MVVALRRWARANAQAEGVPEETLLQQLLPPHTLLNRRNRNNLLGRGGVLSIRDFL